MPASDLQAYQAYFEAGLARSLARYEERVGQSFSVPTSIRCVSDGTFWASARGDKRQLTLSVSTGALDRIHTVWNRALHVSSSLPSASVRRIALLGHESHAVETSVAWLIQHELNHHAIGHFDLIDGAGLAEGVSPYGLGIVERARRAQSSLSAFTPKEMSELHQCLELQTDHDATEIVLGAYSAENWPLFRYYAICILVVIFIIEAEERQSSDPLRYHPYAATRLFMLIAHLVELPTIPGIKRAHAEGLDHLPKSYLPTADEMGAYRSEVVKPVMAASQIIAEACGIPEAWDDLGTADAFFADIDAILIHHADKPEAFQTQGAKQWAELKPLNDKYLRMLGW